jgi:hypothetical protein
MTERPWKLADGQEAQADPLEVAAALRCARPLAGAAEGNFGPFDTNPWLCPLSDK